MTTIAVIGLGYVGLPLAVEFGKKFKTIGFDLSAEKIEAYRRHVDPTGEVSTEDLRAAVHLTCTTDPAALREADFIIVAVPTPVDDAHQPDFTPLVSREQRRQAHEARRDRRLRIDRLSRRHRGDLRPDPREALGHEVEDATSSSATRPSASIPGDKEHTLTRILKVVSGDTPETLEKVAELYGSIITAGVYRASSIKVAEAAKVIENTQRDLNIALMNELAIIFDRIGIDTLEVLQAAGTKWNFLPFRPGLVGGHCIGVDPYYLTHKAEMIGYHPQVILAGRRINDGMGKFIAEQTVKQMIAAAARSRARASTCSA